MKSELTSMNQSGRTKDSQLGDFILRLQEDYKLLDEFNKDPDKVMKDAGIKSEEMRNILKSRDLIKIENLLFETNRLT